MARVTLDAESSTDVLYYNARFSNYEAPGLTNPPLTVSFQDSRPAPLLKTGSAYELSIIRFQTTLQLIPALLVQHPVQAGATPPNTSYQFRILNQVGTVQWTPSAPGLQQTTGDFFDRYWWLESGGYIRFGSMVNACIQGIVAQLIAANALPAGTPAPYFSYNSSTAIWSLYIPDYFKANNITLQANSDSHFLFKGFPAQVLTNEWYAYLNVFQPNETVSGGYWIRQQIPGSLTNWCPVRRFVFTSQQLPIVPEAILPITSNPLFTHSGNATQRVVSDLTPQLNRGDEFSSGVLDYTPSAEFRMISLTGSTEIQTIDLQAWWEDNLGQLHPHQLAGNGYLSVKLMFRRRL